MAVANVARRFTRWALFACALAAAACSSPAPSCDGCRVGEVCIPQGAPCDDGLFCTDADRCIAGACTGVPRDCGDRIDCNGVETCDEATRSCRPGTPTCAAGEVCDAAANRCVRRCLGCLVAGTCYGDGEVNPADQCQRCDLARDPFAWSDRDGLACDDGLFCTVGDVCSGTTCAGAPRDCSDGLACDGIETCDEAAKACQAAASPCGSDEICDAVADRCKRLVCTDGCLVAGVCWGDAQVNPANPCLVCDVARSATTWSDRDGARCDDGLWCTVDDTCAGGACAGAPRDCSDGRVCDGLETCDEATDVCVRHAPPSCDSSAVCADACTQLGQLLPYFVATVQPVLYPTAGGVTATLLGSFGGDVAGASLVDLAQPLDLTSGIAFWTSDCMLLLVPAGSRDRDVTFRVAGGTLVPHLAEVVQGWTHSFVQRPTFPIRYRPPTVERVSGCVDDTATTAASCSVTGGERIRIQGQDFGNDAAEIGVRVGGRSCGGVRLETPHTAISCVLPASPEGGFDVEVAVSVAGRVGTRAGLSYFGPEVGSVFAPTPGDARGAPTNLDPQGGTTLVVGGRFFGTVESDLRVLIGSDPNLVVTTVQVLSTDPTLIATIAFRAPPGIGAGYPVVVQVGQLRTKPSATLVSYRFPVIVPGTLQLDGSFVGFALTASTLPATLSFDVQDAGPRGSDLQVWLVDGSGEGELCTDPVLAGTTATRRLSCGIFSNLSTRDVPLGPSMAQIQVPNGASAPGTDTVAFPQPVLIGTMAGCTDVGSTTTACATEGGEVIRVEGDYLPAEGLELVVGDRFVDVRVLDSRHLQFVLPPGVGSARVTARVTGTLSRPWTLEYGSPFISTVSGCTDWQGTTGDCPIAGGTALAIAGGNFGAAGAEVFVGAARCGDVVHDAVDPHHRLTCVLPPGLGERLPVIVVNGKLSENAGSLSYHVP